MLTKLSPREKQFIVNTRNLTTAEIQILAEVIAVFAKGVHVRGNESVPQLISLGFTQRTAEFLYNMWQEGGALCKN